MSAGEGGGYFVFLYESETEFARKVERTRMYADHVSTDHLPPFLPTGSPPLTAPQTTTYLPQAPRFPATGAFPWILEATHFRKLSTNLIHKPWTMIGRRVTDILRSISACRRNEMEQFFHAWLLVMEDARYVVGYCGGKKEGCRMEYIEPIPRIRGIMKIEGGTRCMNFAIMREWNIRIEATGSLRTTPIPRRTPPPANPLLYTTKKTPIPPHEERKLAKMWWTVNVWSNSPPDCGS